MGVDMKNFYSFNMADHISQCELVVDDNVDGKDNEEGKTTEVADISITLVGTFFNQGVMMVDIKVSYTFNKCDNLMSCVLMVDDTVDGKDNQMEATMQVGDIMMYHFNQNVLQ